MVNPADREAEAFLCALHDGAARGPMHPADAWTLPAVQALPVTAGVLEHATDHPTHWPRCGNGCGELALDGQPTCGRADCQPAGGAHG